MLGLFRHRERTPMGTRRVPAGIGRRWGPGGSPLGSGADGPSPRVTRPGGLRSTGHLLVLRSGQPGREAPNGSTGSQMLGVPHSSGTRLGPKGVRSRWGPAWLNKKASVDLSSRTYPRFLTRQLSKIFQFLLEKAPGFEHF